MKALAKLATLFRSLQFYAHAAHNVTKGSTFFEDHSFFGDLYSTYEDAYDGLIERIIGLGYKPDIMSITKDACAEFTSSSFSSFDPVNLFSKLSEGENQIQRQIESLATSDECSQGTLNFIADLADKSEMRTYKIKQRLG